MICDNCGSKIKRKDFFYTIEKERSWIGKIITSTVNQKRFCGFCYYNLIDGKEEGRIKDIEYTNRQLNIMIFITVLFGSMSLFALQIMNNLPLAIISFFITMLYFVDTIRISKIINLKEKNV